MASQTNTSAMAKSDFAAGPQHSGAVNESCISRSASPNLISPRSLAAVEDIWLNEIMFLLSHPKRLRPELLPGFHDSQSKAVNCAGQLFCSRNATVQHYLSFLPATNRGIIPESGGPTGFLMKGTTIWTQAHTPAAPTLTACSCCSKPQWH